LLKDKESINLEKIINTEMDLFGKKGSAMATMPPQCDRYFGFKVI
jgi:hypothetical protein